MTPDISLDELAGMLEGYSGADIRRICEKASDIPFYGRHRLATLEKQLLDTSDPLARFAVAADLGEAFHRR